MTDSDDMSAINDDFRRRSSKVAYSRTKEERERAAKEAISVFERIGREARAAGLTEEMIAEELCNNVDKES